MALIGDLVARMRIEKAGFDKGLSESTQQLRRIRNEAEQVRPPMNRLQTSFASLGRTIGVAAVALAAVRVGRSLIDAASTVENLRSRLESLTGSAALAEQSYKAFAAAAATTPFELKDVVEAGVTLKSFGADAERLIPLVADLAAFMGTDIQSAAQSFGRAFAAGAGAADVLRERGVLALISLKTGIQDLTKLSLPEFRRVLIQTLQDPTAGIIGSTERLSRTFSGAMSNMSDALFNLSNTLGSTFLPQLTAGIQKLTALINLANEFAQWGGMLSPQNIFGRLPDFLADTREQMFNAIQTLKRADFTPREIFGSFDELRKRARGASEEVRLAVGQLITARKILGEFPKSVAAGAGGPGIDKNVQKAIDSADSFIDSLRKQETQLQIQKIALERGSIAALEFGLGQEFAAVKAKMLGDKLPIPADFAKRFLTARDSILEAARALEVAQHQAEQFDEVIRRIDQDFAEIAAGPQDLQRILDTKFKDLDTRIPDLSKTLSLEILSPKDRQIAEIRQEFEERKKLIEDWRLANEQAGNSIHEVNRRAAELSTLAWQSAQAKITAISEETNTFAQHAIEGIQNAVASGFEDILSGNIRSWEEWGKSITRVINQVVSQFLAAQLNAALFGAGAGRTGQIGGLIGSLFSFAGLFSSSGFNSPAFTDIAGPGTSPVDLLDREFGAMLAGARQHGGPVMANRPYIVGERAPELFIPDTSGDIVPLDKRLAKATRQEPPVVNVTIVANDIDSFRRSESEMRRTFAKVMRATTRNI